MQRITISIDEDLATTFDALVAARGYQSRSEGVRDAVREAVERWRAEQTQTTHCVANLSYIYNPRIRSLAARLADLQHARHDLIVSTTQVRLDHEHCFESVMLKGEAVAVRAFADEVRAERGVKFGALNLVGVAPNDDHVHADGHVHHGHAHYSPHPG